MIEWTYLVSSCISSTVSRILTHPLDTRRIRAQVLPALSRSTGPTSATLSIKTRILHLYRGLGVSLLFMVPGFVFYLSTYDTAKAWLSTHFIPEAVGQKEQPKSQPVMVHLFSAMAAEIVSGVFWTPLDVIKSNMQVSDAHSLRSRDQISHIYRLWGVKGFFKGYWVGLAVFTPYSLVFFLSYEQFKRNLADWNNQRENSSNLSFAQYFVASAGAASLASITSHSLEVLKSQSQTSDLSVRAIIQGILKSTSSIFSMKNGILSLFTKGLGARLLYVIPSAGLNLAIYESIKAHFVQQSSS